MGDSGGWTTVAVTPLIATADGINWYEKPDGMSTAEFLGALTDAGSWETWMT